MHDPLAASGAPLYAIDKALAALRADSQFWRQPLETAIPRVLTAVVHNLPIDRVQLWQLEHDPVQLRLRPEYLAQRNGVDGAPASKLVTPPSSYLAALSQLQRFMTSDSVDIFKIDEHPEADRAGAVHAAIFIRRVLWGVLVLSGVMVQRASDHDLHGVDTAADLIARLLLEHGFDYAESRFHTIVADAPIGIVQFDESRRVLYRNRSFVDLLGADYQSFAPAIRSKVVAANNQADVSRDAEMLSQTGAVQTYRLFTRPDGSERHVHLFVVSEKPSPNALTATGHTSFLIDTTAQWQAQRQLHEMTTRYRAILDNAAHAIVATDMQGKVTLFNPAAERLLGYRAAEVLGHRTSMLNSDRQLRELMRGLSANDYAEAYAAALNKARQEGAYEVEDILQHKDGRQVPVTMFTTALLDIGGEPMGLMSIAVDQTDRQRLNAMEQREQGLITQISHGTNAVVGEQFFDQLSGALREVTGADYAAVFMLKPELPGLQGVILKTKTTPAQRIETVDFSNSPLDPVLREKQSIHLLNAQEHYPHIELLKQLGQEELIAVPLLSSTGKVLGAMMLAHRGRLPEAMLAEHLLEIFAVRASAELERLQNERLLRAREEEQQWLYTASEQIHAQADIDSIARAAAETGARHHSAPRVCVSLNDNDRFHILAYAGPPEGAPTQMTFPRIIGVYSEFFADKNAIKLFPDFQTAVQANPLHDEAVALNARAVAIIGLTENGQDIGTITFDYPDAASFEQLDLNILGTFGRSVSLAMARALHREQLEYQASHDTLTGLLNRAALHREFEHWLAAGGKQTALLLFDLNRFKEVNDTFGHHVGDALLCQIGERLRVELDYQKITLARLGGDEFAVLLNDPSVGASRARTVVNNLLVALRQPFEVDGVHLEIGASVGVALYPEHGDDSHALLRAADVAMYNAKQSGSDVTIYDHKLDFNTPERLALISDFSKGLRNNELVLFYQPKIDLNNRLVVGFEALLRWQHPQLGLLSPDRFLPLVEMSDAIHALTQTVLDIACQQLQTWIAAGEPWSVSVNLSARNLIDNRVLRYVSEIMQRYQIPPGRLELEITETALIQDPEHALELLRQIAALGVALSIDDFGTGYSSLAYLRSMPISTLKIDRTFVRDLLTNPQDQKIARSIVQLAHSLDLLVVAEGVENEEVLARLRAKGCDQAQGYYFSKPLPPEKLQPWIAQWRARYSTT